MERQELAETLLKGNTGQLVLALYVREEPLKARIVEIVKGERIPLTKHQMVQHYAMGILRTDMLDPAGKIQLLVYVRGLWPSYEKRARDEMSYHVGSIEVPSKLSSEDPSALYLLEGLVVGDAQVEERFGKERQHLFSACTELLRWKKAPMPEPPPPGFFDELCQVPDP
jgi:hypothetical protein